MKLQPIISFGLVTMLLAATIVSVANVTSSPLHDTLPSTQARTGYWNLEYNIQTPKTCTLYFYNEAHELVYQENVNGKKIRVSNRRTCKKLDGILREVLFAYEQRRQAFADERLVARAMGNKN